MSLSSGVGLISGLDIRSLVDQLISIEARPRDLVTRQNQQLNAQQVAYQEINAKLLVLDLSVGALARPTTFSTTQATSSNESVLTASSSATTTPGSHSFVVDRLVSAQQLITRGFADRDQTPVSDVDRTLSFEFGDARLDRDARLDELNAGAGAPRGRIRITDRSGASATVDLSRAITVQDVISQINQTDGVNVTASVSRDGLTLTDNTGLTSGNLTVSDLAGGATAAGLGLTGSVSESTLVGQQINRLGADMSLSLLNDGNGVERVNAVPDLRIASRDGTQVDINLAAARTVGDVIARINSDGAGVVQAEIDESGVGIRLTDLTTGGQTFEVTDLNGSRAARDLGLLGAQADDQGVMRGNRLLGSLDSKLLGTLRGGAGVDARDAVIDITNSQGGLTSVDLSGAGTVRDVIDAINAAGAGVTASLNDSGAGLVIRDNAGGALTIADQTGSLANSLGLAGTHDQGAADTGRLDAQYIARATLLENLRGGQGIQRGTFRITDSSGKSATVDLTQGNELTIGDVIDEINSRGLAVNARINDAGNGIMIEDQGSGVVALTVAESGSRTASDLGILGAATEPGDDLVGSFRKTVDISQTDSLQAVVDKINEAGIDISASVVNDGSPQNPFRLSLGSRVAGEGGAFVFDDGGLNLGAATLSEARNARVFYGSADPSKAIAIESATNTLAGVIPGSTVRLQSASAQPVTVTVRRDDDAIVSAVKKVVDDFNAVIDSLNKYDKFDPETEERGVLLGESAVNTIRSSLFRVMNQSFGEVTGSFRNPVQVGLKVGSGAKLQLDETRFQQAMASDRAGVVEFFSLLETETDEQTNTETVTRSGFAKAFQDAIRNLTSENGTVTSRLGAIQNRVQLNDDRIESLNVLLDNRRSRLESEFFAMETALAQLQNQSNALASLQQISAQSGAGAIQG